ncbi:hypothetical protein [Streptomyces shaanxiensis]
MTTRLIDESLFESRENQEYDDGAPRRLMGARCSGCTTVVSPAASGAGTGRWPRMYCR